MLKWEFLYICELFATAKKSREILQKRFMTLKKQLRERERERKTEMSFCKQGTLRS